MILDGWMMLPRLFYLRIKDMENNGVKVNGEYITSNMLVQEKMFVTVDNLLWQLLNMHIKETVTG